jgi:hypothetical protein
MPFTAAIPVEVGTVVAAVTVAALITTNVIHLIFQRFYRPHADYRGLALTVPVARNAGMKTVATTTRVRVFAPTAAIFLTGTNCNDAR